MGVVSQATTGLARGASNARRIITGKTANKNFYKGTGSGRMGRWTTRGRFVLEEWRFRKYVVPDLSECELKPFISPKAEEPPLRVHTVLDYFPAGSEGVGDMSADFIARCRRRAELGLQRT